MACRDRQGSLLPAEKAPSGVLRFLYDCAAGRPALGLLSRPGVSRAVGRLMDSRASRCLIPLFLRKTGIDMTDYENCLLYTSPSPRDA